MRIVHGDEKAIIEKNNIKKLLETLKNTDEKNINNMTTAELKKHVYLLSKIILEVLK